MSGILSFLFFEIALIPYHSKSNYQYNVMVRSILTSLCIIKQIVVKAVFPLPMSFLEQQDVGKYKICGVFDGFLHVDAEYILFPPFNWFQRIQSVAGRHCIARHFPCFSISLSALLVQCLLITYFLVRRKDFYLIHNKKIFKYTICPILIFKT